MPPALLHHFADRAWPPENPVTIHVAQSAADTKTIFPLRSEWPLRATFGDSVWRRLQTISNGSSASPLSNLIDLISAEGIGSPISWNHKSRSSMMSRGHVLPYSRHRCDVAEIAIDIQTPQKPTIIAETASTAASSESDVADFKIISKSANSATAPRNTPNATNRVAIPGESLRKNSLRRHHTIHHETGRQPHRVK
jgi:hypothetical protein